MRNAVAAAIVTACMTFAAGALATAGYPKADAHVRAIALRPLRRLFPTIGFDR